VTVSTYCSDIQKVTVLMVSELCDSVVNNSKVVFPKLGVVFLDHLVVCVAADWVSLISLLLS